MRDGAAHGTDLGRQAQAAGGGAGRVLEGGLSVNVLGAVFAAVGIARDRRSAWVLGVVVAVVSVVLWSAQETVGLPGLPRSWTEPSRIVAVLVEAGYVVMAAKQFARRRVSG